eukprot:7304634-Alexandrium_andersonii.AAC.1
MTLPDHIECWAPKIQAPPAFYFEPAPSALLTISPKALHGFLRPNAHAVDPGHQDLLRPVHVTPAPHRDASSKKAASLGRRSIRGRSTLGVFSEQLKRRRPELLNCCLLYTSPSPRD